MVRSFARDECRRCGTDDGGQDDPSHSMDPWQTRARIPLTTRELRSTEMYANAIVHSNGVRYSCWRRRLYDLYCSRVLAWRNKAGTTYAPQEGKSRIVGSYPEL